MITVRRWTLKERRWLPWTIRRIVEVLSLALVVEYLVLPQLAGTNRWLSLLAGADWWWVAAAFVAEMASLLAFSLATRSLLPPERRPGLWRLWRIDLAGIALSHSVPGGAAAGTALGYRLLHRSGVDTGTATFAKVGQGAISALVLQALLLSSLAIAIPLHGTSPLYLTAALIGVGLFVAVVALTTLLIRGEPRLARIAAALTARVPRLSRDSGSDVVHGLARDVRAVIRQPRRFAASVGWSMANWLLDALALWCSVAAFGHFLGYDGVLVPFCLANTAAWIPLTPSGLGIVEGVIIPTLVGFATPRGIAVLGTTTWRLINFWLPIPLGAVAYFSLPREDPSAAEAAPTGG
jgi:uncharacterized protein (TIRG00374 family)